MAKADPSRSRRTTGLDSKKRGRKSGRERVIERSRVGRPPKDASGAGDSITLYLTKPVIEWLSGLAAHEGRSRSEVAQGYLDRARRKAG